MSGKEELMGKAHSVLSCLQFYLWGFFPGLTKEITRVSLVPFFLFMMIVIGMLVDDGDYCGGWIFFRRLAFLSSR